MSNISECHLGPHIMANGSKPWKEDIMWKKTAAVFMRLWWLLSQEL